MPPAKAQKRRKMPSHANLCPFCRGLNSAGERRCYRCGRALPGPLVSGIIAFFTDSFGGAGAMTRFFLVLSLIVFALSVITDHHIPLWWGEQFSQSTLLRFGATGGPLGLIEPWRYLSAVFVHANLLHVGMNSWVLASVGLRVESELGKARFVMLFVLSGVLGFLTGDVYYGFMGAGGVGASGSIFGLFGAAIGVAYARRDPTWKQLLLQNVVWLVILSLLDRTNNAAHVGGLATGALLGFLFSKETRKLNLDRPFALIAGLFVVLSVASIGLSAFSPISRAIHAREMGREY